MTDAEAVEAARKELRALLLKVWHKHEHKFNGLAWAPLALDIEDAIAAHTEAALKELRYVYDEAKFEQRQLVEDNDRLRAQLAAAEGKGQQTKPRSHWYEEAMRLQAERDALTAERDAARAQALADRGFQSENARLKAAVEQARQLLAHVVKRLLQPKLDEIMGDWAAADIERVAALTASAPKETVMTDDAAVEAARKKLARDTASAYHQNPLLTAPSSRWLDVADVALAHTKAALKEKETDRADYEIVVSESSYRTQAEIEALHAELAAAKDRASGLQEFAARQSGEIVTLVGERDALRAAVDQARQALEAARDFIGNGYQPPELIAQIHAALTASATPETK